MVLTGAVSALQRRGDVNTIISVTNKYILEFISVSQSTENQAPTLTWEQETYVALSEVNNDAGIQVIKSFNSPIFTGVSVWVGDHNSESLLKLQGMANVWPMRVITAGSESFSSDASATNYSVHGATGVDKFHAAGIKGKGAVIGIVDIGVWYPHPDVRVSFDDWHKSDCR